MLNVCTLVEWGPDDASDQAEQMHRIRAPRENSIVHRNPPVYTCDRLLVLRYA